MASTIEGFDDCYRTMVDMCIHRKIDPDLAALRETITKVSRKWNRAMDATEVAETTRFRVVKLLAQKLSLVLHKEGVPLDNITAAITTLVPMLVTKPAHLLLDVRDGVLHVGVEDERQELDPF
jgi:hypothetical protein